MASSKIQLTPKQMQIVVLAAVVVLGGGFVYFQYFWKPISARIDAAQSNIETVEGKISKATAQAARLPQIQRELVVLNQQATEAEKRLPKERDLPDVIDTISSLSQKYRVNLASFSPGNPTTKQFFIEVPYAVTATGGFHDIGRFFAAVALEERIFNVRNVTFSGGQGGLGKVNVNFTLIAYQYKG